MDDKHLVRTTPLEFLDVQEVLQLDGHKESFASEIGLNPYILWVKFILTDDQPNNNKEIVPKDEFPNLVTSGMFMPIKMSEGGPSKHLGSTPVGVITHLREVTRGGVNQVVGLGALWTKERKEDIDIIKERYAEDKPLDLSWEILYDPKSSETDAEGNTVLRGAYLRAVTLVAVPAYGGRTIIEEIFAEDNSQEEDKEDKALDNLEALNELNKKLEKERDELQSQLSDLTSQLEEANSTIESLQETQVTEELEAELASLQEFKAEVEAERAEAAREAEVREMFEEAGLEISENYFEENGSVLKKMENEQLEFVISQLVEAQRSMAEDEDEANAEDKRVPFIRQTARTSNKPSDLGRLLREQRQSGS